MKIFFALLFVLSATSLFAQDKKPQIVEYRYVNGKQYGVDSLGNYHKLDFVSYGKDTLPAPILNYQPPVQSYQSAGEQSGPTVSPVPQYVPVSVDRRLNRAGGFLIGAGSAFVIGGLFATGGVVANKAELAYTGAGVGGAGLLLLIGAGAELYLAGVQHRRDKNKSTTMNWHYYGTGASLSVRF